MHSVALSSYPYVLIAFRVVSVNSSMETTTSSPARTCTHRRPFDADWCTPTPPLEVERVVVFVVADSDGARNVVFEAAAVKLIFSDYCVSFLLLLLLLRVRACVSKSDWKYPKKHTSYSCTRHVIFSKHTSLCKRTPLEYYLGFEKWREVVFFFVFFENTLFSIVNLSLIYRVCFFFNSRQKKTKEKKRKGAFF